MLACAHQWICCCYHSRFPKGDLLVAINPLCCSVSCFIFSSINICYYFQFLIFYALFTAQARDAMRRGAARRAGRYVEARVADVKPKRADAYAAALRARLER